MDFQQFFRLAMKRELGEIIDPLPGHKTLELGPGNNPVGDVTLGLPDWDAKKGVIPFPNEAFGGVYAFHFLEHLTGAQTITILREIERVLMPRGVFMICVPHKSGAMAFQDLDHKSFYTEDSWRVLFDNPYYDTNREIPWRLSVKFNLIAGVVERNLALLTVLQKT